MDLDDNYVPREQYEAQQKMLEHLTEMNEKLVNLCEKLSGDDVLLKAQLSHQAPSEGFKALGGRRSWKQIAAELEKKTEREPEKGKKDADGVVPTS